MTQISRRQWRMTVAGIACAAILTPATALAAPAHPAARTAATPACATSDLRAWLGIPGEGALGTTAYQLRAVRHFTPRLHAVRLPRRVRGGRRRAGARQPSRA